MKYRYLKIDFTAVCRYLYLVTLRHYFWLFLLWHLIKIAVSLQADCGADPCSLRPYFLSLLFSIFYSICRCLCAPSCLALCICLQM